MPSSTLVRPDEIRQPGPGRVAGTIRTRREQYASAPDSLLWSPAVVTRWAGVTAVGAISLLVSWYVVAGKADYNDQRVGMSVGIASLVLVSFASLSLLVAGRRVIGMRRVELLGELPVPRTTTATAPVPVQTGPSSEVLVAGDGLLRYHRSDCIMTAGRAYAPADRATHAAAGRMACGVCQP